MTRPGPAVPGPADRLPVRAIARGEPDYPAALDDLPDPPARLFVRGTWPPGSRAVAIVGARASTAYGRAQARRMARDLAREGVVVVSGLAYGIDGEAHAGACESGGVTVAVLPGGIERVVPTGHADLARRILGSGAWLSEHPGTMPVQRGMFIRRNRLVAGLAAAVVVVEAAERSGALATAAVARRLGRTVFAVPGDVDRPASRGCHALLREGARVCEHAGDVLRTLEAVPGPDAAGPAQRLRRVLDDTPRAAEDLARAAAVDLRTALALLLRLRWSGFARCDPGDRWVRIR